ncbi:retroviral-like aspartic protease family protein, partial [Acinetobacter baumannii]
DPSSDKFGTIIDTAGGPALVRRATLPRLDLGPIVARDLDIQIGRNFGDTEVIGMNFLSRLKSWRVEGDRMILEGHP